MLEIGQQIGEFEILSLLGRGGMGSVYKASQTVLKRIVAMKILQPALAMDASFVTRFHNEAVAAAALNHPNLVQVYAAGETGQLHWFAMEFVDGESLQDRLTRQGRLDPAEALAVIMHVANALDYAWRKARMIHRDIKPDNIFLSVDGEVKLGDLGLAKSSGQENSLTMTGASMGTPLYVSPEQAEGRGGVDLRTDVYSLGATLFHLICGVPPFTGPSAVSVMMKHVSAEIPDMRSFDPSLSPALAQVVNKMLQKDPEKRHASYAELSMDLQAAYASIPDSNHPPAGVTPREEEKPLEKTERASLSIGRRAVYAFAGCGVLLFAFLVWLIRSGGMTSSQPSAPMQSAKAPAAGEWRVLFDGKSLDGWRNYGDARVSSFGITEGEIKGAGLLVYDEFFENFELELDWKVTEASGNGGVFFFMTPGEGESPKDLLEMQLCGDEGDPNYKAGALWGRMREEEQVPVPVDRWHKARLSVSGKQCKHWVNEKLVCQYEIGSPEWRRHELNPYYKKSMQRRGVENVRSGWIGIQGMRHISFRNVRLRELPSALTSQVQDKEAAGELRRRLEAKLIPVPSTKIKMSSTELTVGEWKLYLKASGFGQWAPHAPINELHKFSQTDEHPVCEINWHEAKAFGAWISAQTGKKWRLPSNAEWSAAAGKSKYPWGDSFPPSWNEGNYACLAVGEQDSKKIGVDGILGTAPVGSYKANNLGFYDLGGNVREWVSDGFTEGKRALRGCDWWNGEEMLMRSSSVYYGLSEEKKSAVGFRIVREN